VEELRKPALALLGFVDETDEGDDEGDESQVLVHR
jgi:hypothetical protein